LNWSAFGGRIREAFSKCCREASTEGITNVADAAIIVEGLVKKFGTVVALDGVDFEVRAGTVFGLLGPNGAGKTTTIKMLITLLQPSSGTVELDGLDPAVNQNEVRQRCGIVTAVGEKGPVMVESKCPMLRNGKQPQHVEAASNHWVTGTGLESAAHRPGDRV
jgi:ABC-type branched-subunit amino acid transport system ATPase component